MSNSERLLDMSRRILSRQVDYPDEEFGPHDQVSPGGGASNGSSEVSLLAQITRCRHITSADGGDQWLYDFISRAVAKKRNTH